MSKYHAIIKDLKSNSSRLYKEAKLAEHREDQILKKIFFYAYNPFFQFYIKKIPDYDLECFGPTPTTNWDEVFSVLDDLRARRVTGHAARDHVLWLFGRIDPLDVELVRLIINKDMDCGASGNTVNKIWEGCLPVFDVMKASNYDAKLLKNIVFPAKVETKADGMRINVIVNIPEKTVKYFSRAGKEYDFLGVHDDLFYTMACSNQATYDAGGAVYDGEALVFDEARQKVLPRKTGNGILQKAGKGTISQEEADRVLFSLWDKIPLNAWLAKHDPRDVLLRQGDLSMDIYDHSGALYDNRIRMIWGQLVNSLEEVNELYSNHRADGEEGVILKNVGTGWEPIRHKEHIKFKAENDADLRCTGVVLGHNNKYHGLIASLNLESEDGKITVNVGSGLSDADRAMDPDKYIGKVIEITYNEKIQSGDDWSLFLPRFNCIRSDKEVANTWEEIS